MGYACIFSFAAQCNDLACHIFQRYGFIRINQNMSRRELLIHSFYQGQVILKTALHARLLYAAYGFYRCFFIAGSAYLHLSPFVHGNHSKNRR
ncbi:hypothetical protein SDC9_186810 [bioreactor metagenome]|uniref:Uncharacterized protein n=1 Tax=bioreactor metagenome TaxID=1076179 RepID=A0A645HLH2_9ZZZZ